MVDKYIAYSITDSDDGKPDRKDWLRVGIAFPNKDGKGFNIHIREGIAVTGHIALRKFYLTNSFYQNH